MKKNFFYRVEPGVILGEIISMSIQERGEWITQVAIDLQHSNHDEAKTSLAKTLIEESNGFRNKRRESGRLGGLAKASTAKAKASTAVAKPSKPLASSSSSSSKEPLVQKREDGFKLFWDAFDYKKGKGGAEISWAKIALTNKLLNSIIIAAKQEAENRPALIEKGQTPKMAQGWLTERRWEDENIPLPSNDPFDVAAGTARGDY